MECGMTMERPEALERLFPAFHGQSAQILAYVAARGKATPEEIQKDLDIPRSTVYKLLTEFFQTGLVTKEKAGKVELVRVPDFVFRIENTANIVDCKLTPRNILAFDAAHTPAGRMFIGRRGLQAFARFVELYDVYKRDRTTAQLMARELGVTRYEVELLLSDIDSITPRSLELANLPGHR